jgi:hypothetical protein
MNEMRYHIAWVAGFALLTDARVVACKCLGVPSPPAALAEAGEVFAGRVIDITYSAPVLPGTGGDGSVELTEEQIFFDWFPVEVTFQVSETWKGPNTITKVVRTGTGGGDCGYRFTPGSDYLVYTFGSEDWRLVSACSRTRFYATAEEDRRFLGAGERPIHPVLSIHRDHGTAIVTWQTNWTSFRLETTESLQPPVVWKAVSNPVEVRGGNYAVALEAILTRSLFRLVR